MQLMKSISNFNSIYFKSFIFALVILVTGCSSNGSNQQSEQSSTATSNDVAETVDTSDPRDPLESINRPFWTFTWDYADKYVIKPTANAYGEYVHPDIRTGLYNMALNLNEPSTIINNLLQGKFTDAAKSTGRFLLNSTIGLLGIFDPASDFGWGRQQEEFGEVLGRYGVPDGPYIVIPGLGPSSVRDEAGDFVDRYYWPLAVIDFWPNIVRAGIIGLEARIALKDQEQLIKDSLDPYEFVKNAYFQNMEYKVYDGNPPIKVDEEAEADIEAFMDELDGL